jgi:hypothetical protein
MTKGEGNTYTFFVELLRLIEHNFSPSIMPLYPYFVRPIARCRVGLVNCILDIAPMRMAGELVMGSLKPSRRG